ncbi:MAG: hypothetical protein DRG78_03575 [Epsilonproteobacteria bacterium]|nr:MAG: hypothetical protein DRG78_03575 [Campylobacterota bacterium]
MPIQVLHEAEHTRQHSRYNIPALVEIEGKIFNLDNWSASGVAIKDIDEPKKQFLKAKLLFDFGTFSTALEVTLEKKNYVNDTKILGCGFSELTKDKLSFMHYIINAYIAGEVVTAGSIIEILKKDRFTSKDMSKVLNPEMSLTKKILLRIKQLMIYTTLTLIVFGLVTFISFTLYSKLFIVKSLSASIDTQMVIIRAPQPSYYSSLSNIVGKQIKKGDILASMKLIGGGANSIESPSEGRVTIEHVLNKSFVDKGEPLLTIIPSEAKAYIEAKVSALQSSKLIIGQNAKIKLSNGKFILAKVKQIKSVNSLSSLHANPLQMQPTSTFDYIRVILEPTKELDMKHLGEAVSVKIDTLL